MARHKEFEREEVLEKAIKVFWSKGYNATSFQTLTEGMCINRQSIYDTYGDKHTLFMEALTYYYQKRTELITAHFAQDKPVKELIRSFFENSIVNTTTEQKSQGCLLLNVTHEMLPHDKEVEAIVNKNMKDLTGIFESAIARGIRSGEIVTTQTADILAIYLVNTVQGLITLSKTITDKKKLRAVTEMAVSTLG
jgi:TetR/AcrR family transcriptional repressor of nem operon